MVESSPSQPLKSFIQYSEDNHFPLENIPFGAFENSSQGNAVHCCTRIGQMVVDLAVLEKHGLFNGTHFSSLLRKDIFSQPNINHFIGLGKDFWKEARLTI
jgi:fumarylacetoacetase